MSLLGDVLVPIGSPWPPRVWKREIFRRQTNCNFASYESSIGSWPNVRPLAASHSSSSRLCLPARTRISEPRFVLLDLFRDSSFLLIICSGAWTVSFGFRNNCESSIPSLPRKLFVTGSPSAFLFVVDTTSTRPSFIKPRHFRTYYRREPLSCHHLELILQFWRKYVDFLRSVRTAVTMIMSKFPIVCIIASPFEFRLTLTVHMTRLLTYVANDWRTGGDIQGTRVWSLVISHGHLLLTDNKRKLR